MKRMLAIFVLSGLSVGAFADDVKQACTDLVLDYAYYRDQLDADKFSNIFSDDATLTVLGDVFVGKDAIKARLQDGKNGPITRHMMSTIRIFQQDANHASGVSYVTVYGAPQGDFPLKVDDFLAIGEYHDKFVKTDSGWKISRRTFVPVFMN